MKIRVRSYGGDGILSEERIGFQVLQDCNLKFFVVYHTLKTEGGFFNRPIDVFWFYPKEVKTGDEVVLYTKAGVDNSRINEDGHTVHFLFWGLDHPILQKGECVVLSEVTDWSVFKYDEKRG